MKNRGKKGKRRPERTRLRTYLDPEPDAGTVKPSRTGETEPGDKSAINRGDLGGRGGGEFVLDGAGAELAGGVSVNARWEGDVAIRKRIKQTISVGGTCF